jgi:ketosteroid isomerase-like protein
MLLNLHTSIALYFSAVNNHDPERVGECFAQDAIVKDEGKTMQGLEAIRNWMTETTRKYHHTMEPLSFEQKGHATVVTNRLTGDFPGSPLELEFSFVLKEGKIAELEIH